MSNKIIIEYAGRRVPIYLPSADREAVGTPCIKPKRFRPGVKQQLARLGK